jgi:glycine/D-amino acid oxidase-like deaminating enzyme
MRREWDAIVVGLGGIGSAAARWLAARYGDRAPITATPVPATPIPVPATESAQ